MYFYNQSLANESAAFYNGLSSQLAQKYDQLYTITIGWLRCRLSFSLLRSLIHVIRGACSSTGQFEKEVHTQSLIVVVSKSRLDTAL